MLVYCSKQNTLISPIVPIVDSASTICSRYGPCDQKRFMKCSEVSCTTLATHLQRIIHSSPSNRQHFVPKSRTRNKARPTTMRRTARSYSSEIFKYVTKMTSQKKEFHPKQILASPPHYVAAFRCCQSPIDCFSRLALASEN